MTIKIVPNDKGNPPGKLADAELHFTSGPLEGLKLIGFGVWERRRVRAETWPSLRANIPSTAKDVRSHCCDPLTDTAASGPRSRPGSCRCMRNTRPRLRAEEVRLMRAGIYARVSTFEPARSRISYLSCAPTCERRNLDREESSWTAASARRARPSSSPRPTAPQRASSGGSSMCSSAGALDRLGRNLRAPAFCCSMTCRRSALRSSPLGGGPRCDSRLQRAPSAPHSRLRLRSSSASAFRSGLSRALPGAGAGKASGTASCASAATGRGPEGARRCPGVGRFEVYCGASTGSGQVARYSDSIS